MLSECSLSILLINSFNLNLLDAHAGVCFFFDSIPNLANSSGENFILAVSENINDCGGKFNGVPPSECLFPPIVYNSCAPSLSKSVSTVSPFSASRLAVSLGTPPRAIVLTTLPLAILYPAGKLFIFTFAIIIIFLYLLQQLLILVTVVDLCS